MIDEVNDYFGRELGKKPHDEQTGERVSIMMPGCGLGRLVRPHIDKDIIPIMKSAWEGYTIFKKGDPLDGSIIVPTTSSASPAVEGGRLVVGS